MPLRPTDAAVTAGDALRAVVVGTSLILLAAVFLALFTMLSVLQRCPHCRKIVRRARSRRWLRCRHCGRQYNSTVGPLTS